MKILKGNRIYSAKILRKFKNIVIFVKNLKIFDPDLREILKKCEKFFFNCKEIT